MGDGVAVGRDPRRTSACRDTRSWLEKQGCPAGRSPHGRMSIGAVEVRGPQLAFPRTRPHLHQPADPQVQQRLRPLRRSEEPEGAPASRDEEAVPPAGAARADRRAESSPCRPALTIMDCSRFFGPNVLISGDNCGEIDATACRLLEIDEPEHVRLSRSAGVFAPRFSVDGEEAGIGASRRAPKPERPSGWGDCASGRTRRPARAVGPSSRTPRTTC